MIIRPCIITFLLSPFYPTEGTAPCCGIVPALASELVPWAPATAISLQKSSEQLGIFIGPMVAGTLIATLGYRTALVGYGTIAILGNLMFLMGVPEPKLGRENGQGM